MALEVFPVVVSDATVRVSVWLCVPSSGKTPRSGIAGSRGRSVFDLVRNRQTGPQRQDAGMRLLVTPLPPLGPVEAGLGEVSPFRFHSLVTYDAPRLSMWASCIFSGGGSIQTLCLF